MTTTHQTLFSNPNRRKTLHLRGDLKHCYLGTKFDTASTRTLNSTSHPINLFVERSNCSLFTYEAFEWVQSGVPFQMWFNEESSSRLSSKLTYQWRMDPLKMYLLVKKGTFHCYVTLPKGSWTWHHRNSHIEGIQKSIGRNPTRWAPTSYTWTYNLYKWPYKWVTEVTSPI